MDRRNRRGKNHPGWKGGRITGDPRGYVEIYAPDHPRNQRGYVREHILLAEKALGKFLPPKAHVHHYTPIQLVICQDAAYHSFLHRRQRARDACGHPTWIFCRYCSKWDAPEMVYIEPNKPGQGWHKACRNQYLVAKRLAKKGLSIEQSSWRKCWICKRYDDPKNLIIPANSGAHHHSCRLENDRRKREMVRLSEGE